MKLNKTCVSYLIAIAVALAIALIAISFEIENFGNEPALLIQFLSDGFFTSAVLYIGCSVLMFIEEAGNFYGIQYLGHMLLCIFSFRKERFEGKKSFFEYCSDKQAKRKERGKSSLKWILLFVGLGCLVLCLIFTTVFYQIK